VNHNSESWSVLNYFQATPQKFSRVIMRKIMQSTPVQFFLRSAGILLLITAFAKLGSSFGSAKYLESLDPLLSISFRHLFRIVGMVELGVAFICFFGKPTSMRASFVAWLATAFALYRFGLWWIDYHKPCSCLGNLTDAIHLSPEAADAVMKIILAYLLIGSYVTLFWRWRQRRQLASGISEVGASS